MDHNYATIISLLEKCKSEPDLDKRIEMLYMINAMLPQSRPLKIPSLITNDYVYQALSYRGNAAGGLAAFCQYNDSAKAVVTVLIYQRVKL